jgi:hypothetical protein
MPTDHDEPEDIDWSLTTWNGARREQMRRMSKMSLVEMIRTLEEMHAIAEWLKNSEQN